VGRACLCVARRQVELEFPPTLGTRPISEGTKEYVSQTVRLRPGRELSVRVKVYGRTARKVAIKVAEGLGQAFVVVAAAAVILGIAYLELKLEEHKKAAGIITE